jgi:hypothetical protein
MCTSITRRATGALACEQPCRADRLPFAARESTAPLRAVAPGVHPVVPSEAATDRR